MLPGSGTRTSSIDSVSGGACISRKLKRIMHCDSPVSSVLTTSRGARIHGPNLFGPGRLLSEGAQPLRVL